ncbi:MAG TPA: DEAD/DEAH box helicase [Pirellulales bacterium]|nr:DEAD/DEAH box helicase [Pirellulales bacterium]
MPSKPSASRPTTAAILAQLKDFQRETVEHVFRRLYTDADHARRFLVADEVGLGKTLVARGVIAKAIDHLWDRTQRIDVVYVCSNTDIARQNINRLNVTGQKDFCLASRITLLPLTLANMRLRRLNFVSFTPGTSFELSHGAGQSLERVLIYWLIANEHDVSRTRATRLFEANAGTDSFRNQVDCFPTAHPSPHPKIAKMFWERLSNTDLLRKFDELCGAMPRAGMTVPPELHRDRNRLIGELRRLLAESCLNWLEPDLIILDEFQRFKHLLESDVEEPTEAAQLAHHLFNYQQSQTDSSLAARVLLLSATPYKMYTLAREKDQDDHYADFERTLHFLMPSPSSRDHVAGLIRRYREHLFDVAVGGNEQLLGVKRELEVALRQVMVRTERLALTPDRNGMLADVKQMRPQLMESDVEQYLVLQRVARSLESDDVLEYWKSAPYLLNFMDEYQLKRTLRDELASERQASKFVDAMRGAKAGLLRPEVIEAYGKLDPGNARLRALHDDVIERGAWRLLWIPPSLPYSEPRGAFATPTLQCFTKRLVFSCWRVVPKAISAILSYEAERRMMRTFSKKARNTAEARKKRRALLRFTFAKGRPTGMPVLGLIYPCRWLVEQLDPLLLARRLRGEQLPVPVAELVQAGADSIESALQEELTAARQRPGPADESWYWAAPLLLDLRHHPGEVQRWFAQPRLSQSWSGEPTQTTDDDSALGWETHVKKAQEFLDGRLELGPPPSDLCEVTAKSGFAGLGVVCLRALKRHIVAEEEVASDAVKTAAAALAHSFLRLFNLPEAMAVLRDRKRETPYWQSVLSYCLDGNLQAVLDEYAHMLIESLGLTDKPTTMIADELSKEMQRCLTLRTATTQVDILTVSSRSVRSEPIRLRTRFAMRFGDQDADDGSEPTRADQVRSAFNSPFWPFVLATTSVGQEGLDFHPYCHAVVHWNLPSNPVDLEQREGRVHRYKGHALRKNIAAAHGPVSLNGSKDIWAAMFEAARIARSADFNDLFPFWVTLDGPAKIERHIPALPLSRDIPKEDQLRRSLVIYRMAFGQNRQEDLVRFLLEKVGEERVRQLIEACRLSLAPT